MDRPEVPVTSRQRRSRGDARRERGPSATIGVPSDALRLGDEREQGAPLAEARAVAELVGIIAQDTCSFDLSERSLADLDFHVDEAAIVDVGAKRRHHLEAA